MNQVRASGIVYPDSVAFVLSTIRDVEPGSVVVLTQEGPTTVSISDPIIMGQGEIKWVDDHAETQTKDHRVITTRVIRITEGSGQVTIITSRQTWVGTDELTFVGVALKDVVTGEPVNSVGIELLFDPEHLPDHVYFGFVPEGWVGRTEEDLAELVHFEGEEPIAGAKELVIMPDGTVSIVVSNMPWMVNAAQAVGFQADVFVIAWLRPTK